MISACASLSAQSRISSWFVNEKSGIFQITMESSCCRRCRDCESSISRIRVSRSNPPSLPERSRTRFDCVIFEAISSCRGAPPGLLTVSVAPVRGRSIE
jgi:hypothetical protein